MFLLPVWPPCSLGPPLYAKRPGHWIGAFPEEAQLFLSHSTELRFCLRPQTVLHLGLSSYPRTKPDPTSCVTLLLFTLSSHSKLQLYSQP
ncbi:rCG41851 [Rattus norvegicus]|uniref:RCG41851 n=1 Tax=Rattus norvegicus TaxID=10116 RepID=A6KKR1_RAT|nr:rCG41851 [Rattus norvegicus]